MTALAAAILDDRTPGSVGHAVPETVLAGTTTVVGLVCAFHLVFSTDS
jgi:hypothetical protein